MSGSLAKRWHQSGPVWPRLLVAGLALAAVSELLDFYRSMTGERVVTLVRLEDVLATGDPATERVALEALARLFGAPIVLPPPSLPPPALPPPVAVPLPRFTLSGVLSGENGVAMIADGIAGDRLYRVGERLPGGARLEAVLDGAVQVSAGDQHYLVRIEWENASGIDAVGLLPGNAPAPAQPDMPSVSPDD